MKIIHLFLIFSNFLLIIPQNLRNLSVASARSEKYIKLTQEAIDTFYQLYNIQLDFKDRYYLEIDDDTKFLRVIINENITSKNENEKILSFNFKNEQIFSDFELPGNVSITLFGRSYNLKSEFWNILNSIFRYTDVNKVTFHEENLDKFDIDK